MTHYSRFETEPGRQEYRLVDLDDPANSATVTVYGDDVVADSIVDHLNATAPAVVSPIETLVNRILDVLEQQGVALWGCYGDELAVQCRADAFRLIAPMLQAAASPQLTLPTPLPGALRRWARAYRQDQQERQPGYYRLDMTRDELEEASEALLAAAFGAPHLRDRVFLVAHARGKQLSQQSQPQSEGSAAADTGGAGVLRPVANGHSRGGTRSALKPQVQAAVFVRPDLVGCGGSHFGAAWQAEPNVDRMADGFPGRVDRIRGLGNAVVPQVAEYVGRRILAAEGER